MLVLTIGDEEFFDESKNQFIKTEGVVVNFEHSLISLSKWESKYEKPFLSADQKTEDEILDYFRFMIISPGVSPDIVYEMNQANFNAIHEYIDSKQTATTFGAMPQRNRGRGEVITSELIYYWMVAFDINWEAQYWHLNRLFSLVKICNIKNSKPKPMSKSEIAARNRELNAQRRRELGTRG